MNNKGTSPLTFTAGHVENLPMPGIGVVSSVGAATMGMVIGLAVNISPIRVNAVAPGITVTGMVAETGEAMASAIHELASRQSLVGRSGKPEEVAEAYVYLMKGKMLRAPRSRPQEELLFAQLNEIVSFLPLMALGHGTHVSKCTTWPDRGRIPR